tara:strand:- start:760 stop:1050 length:291 start_codon:yes stop_codon:yes gene_type:complete
MWHNFELEHKLIHDVVGDCSWNATADRHREACDSRFEGANETLRKCEGPHGTHSSKRVATLISELHAERQARSKCKDGMSKKIPWTGAKRCSALTL